MKVINLFGGPGCGKSTLAAGLFHQMKLQGLNCELVTEFAKDLTWENAQDNRLCQPYVFGVQYLRMQRLKGKVDYVITDSPLLLSSYYARSELGAFHQMVKAYHDSFENMNYILTGPNRRYQPIGRNQTEDEAQQIHNAIWDMLNDYEIPVRPISPDERGLHHILGDINALHSSTIPRPT
jgi:nicotinamide riboside kinase